MEQKENTLKQKQTKPTYTLHTIDVLVSECTLIINTPVQLKMF